MKKVLFGVASLVLCGVGIVLFTLVFLSHLIIPVFPVLAAIFVIYATKTQRAIIKTETTPIYQLTEGLVKLEGTVNAPTALETPFFREQCIGYSYEKAEIDYSDEDGTEYTVNAVQKDDFQDFYLSNSTGKIKVIASHINLSFLQPQIKKIHKIKHTERTLKNGDVITILGKAVRNNHHQFELRENGKNPLVVSNSAIENRIQKALRAVKYLLPYLILMYLSVNYFLFFAPVELRVQKNTAFILFSFFGMPLLSVIFAMIGRKPNGFAQVLLSNLAGICMGVSVLTFPLLCLLFITETEFYRIICIWASVFIFTTLAFIMNYRRLDGIFTKDNKSNI